MADEALAEDALPRLAEARPQRRAGEEPGDGRRLEAVAARGRA